MYLKGLSEVNAALDLLFCAKLGKYLNSLLINFFVNSSVYHLSTSNVSKSLCVFYSWSSCGEGAGSGPIPSRVSVTPLHVVEY